MFKKEFIRRVDDNIIFQVGDEFYFIQALAPQSIPRGYVWTYLYKKKALRWYEKLYLKFKRATIFDLVELFGLTYEQLFDEIFKLKEGFEEAYGKNKARKVLDFFKEEINTQWRINTHFENKFGIKIDEKGRTNITIWKFLKEKYDPEKLAELIVDKGVEFALDD